MNIERAVSIGVFDSGVGGLAVLREIRAQLPTADLLYLADQAHLPYGARPLAEVRSLSQAITRFLLAQGAQAIVIACNTASAAALKHLRARHPAIPFVGMEPAVKPAALNTRTRVVGVLATPATFQGELFASLVERFAQGITVLPQTCPGLVEQIEAGDLDSPKTLSILRQSLTPLLAQGIDHLVLGCTHYPFVRPAIQAIVGPDVHVVDPAPAVARQVARVVNYELRIANNELRTGQGRVEFFTTGGTARFEQMRATLLGGSVGGAVRAARWVEGRLVV